MVNGLIAVLVAAFAVSALILAVGGVIQLLEMSDDRSTARERKQVVDAVKLFKAVSRRIPQLTDSEYDDAVKYVIRKYHMADKHGGLDTEGQSTEYIAMLISETIEQNRLFQATLAIAQAGEEVDSKSKDEMEAIA